MSFRIWHLPVRAATGAHLLHSGYTKRDAPPEVAEDLHGFASSAFPQVSEVPPDRFLSTLSTAEMAVGAVLLTPVVPAGLAGLALTGFSGALLATYLRSPGLTEPGSLRPTEQGVPVAKDLWMVGIGLGLVLDALTPGGRRKRTRKRTRKGKGKGKGKA